MMVPSLFRMLIYLHWTRSSPIISETPHLISSRDTFGVIWMPAPICSRIFSKSLPTKCPKLKLQFHTHLTQLSRRLKNGNIASRPSNRNSSSKTSNACTTYPDLELAFRCLWRVKTCSKSHDSRVTDHCALVAQWYQLVVMSETL